MAPSSTSTATELSLFNRANAHLSWANTSDRAARTAPARAALEQRFLDQAGGDPLRAEHYRKAHFARLAAKSAQSRRRARELTEVADEAEAELKSLGGGPDA